MEIYTRSCPQCNNIISYKDRGYYKQSVKKNRVCRKCGDINANYTKWSTPEIREKLLKSPRFSGKTHSFSTKKKMSEDRSGSKHPLYGIPCPEHVKDAVRKSRLGVPTSPETSKKLSIALTGRKFTDLHKRNIATALRKYKSSTIGSPNYNRTACKLFEQINKHFGWNGQHAENGGEYHIKELGYWVDYYEPIQNIVIEYDEKHHKYKFQKDNIRESEIRNLLKCKFIRLSEVNLDVWKEYIKENI